LLLANRRLNTAYLLKESFGQLWDYRTERGARAFFERWQDSLKWQRLKPYRKFAQLIESPFRTDYRIDTEFRTFPKKSNNPTRSPLDFIGIHQI